MDSGDVVKLEKVARKEKPDYPSFNDHRLKRRSAIKLMFGGLIAAFAAGCNVLNKRVSGETHVPENPDEQRDKPGEELPLKPPVHLEGDIIIADPPERPDPPAERGKIRQPQPPRFKGKMAPVKSPKK